jgi:DNA-binding beta-propeller fold protein YncE
VRTEIYVTLASALVVLGVIVGPVASSAVAAPPTTFATTGEGAGQITAPTGMAVDQSSGDVYIADSSNFRIDKFAADGGFLLAWGFGVADGTSLELQVCGPDAVPATAECFTTPSEGRGSEAPGAGEFLYVAVDQTSGDVYATDDHDRVQKFSPSGEFLLMFGHEVNKTTGANICTKADLEAGDECGDGVEGSGSGELEGRIHPIAVDAGGDVWVGDSGRLEQFSPSGGFLSEVSLPGAEFSPELGSLAVAAGGDFYVIDTATEGVEKLTPSGVVIETLDVTGGAYRAFALDSAGDLFVSDRQAFEDPATFREFDAAGDQLAFFGAGQIFGSEGPKGIAIGNAAATLYSTSSSFANGGEYAAQLFSLPGPGPLISNERAEGVLPTSATLAATLDPEGHETTYHFGYGTSESYGQSTPTKSLSAGFYDETVEASLGELLPATEYHFHLVAEDSEGHLVDGPDQTFTTLPAVQIEAESATDVSAQAATFEAELNPLGVPAEWWVEYGGSEGYGASTAKVGLGAASSPQPVSVRVSGLSSGASYHYRFVARDERAGVVYEVHGEDRSLTTQAAAAAFALPDGRAWEMVTPPVKPGFVLPLGELGDWQAAAGGGALTYLTTPLSEEAPGSRGTDQVLARRDPSTGWGSRDLALPEEEVVGPNAGNLYPYRLFSPDLSRALVEPPSGAFGEALDQPLSPEASERTPYLRGQAQCEESIAACYRPLVTGKAGFANVPPGTQFGGDVSFLGATSDLQHVVLGSSVPLSGDPAPEGGLYEWSAGSPQPQLLSVLPGGGPAPGAAFGYHDEETRNAISGDGSRVAFTSEEHLYLRDTGRGETLQLDAVQGGSGSGAANAVFEAGSVDGSRIFFTDEQRLTADSGARQTKPDLYVCEVRVDEATGKLECALSDLTPRSQSGESAAVRGIVAGAAEDGTAVYFVANGSLSPDGCGENLGNELCDDLYLVRHTAGGWQPPHLIASLSPEDAPDWAGATLGQHALRNLTSRVSPDGRWLAFMSDRPLTGYDNRDVAGGEPDEEVYLYDASANGGEGRLRCASCNPSDARPRGEQIHFPSEAADAQGLWRGRWVAANVPGWTNASGPNTLHQPRYLDDSGRLFFNSADALSPGDTNGTWDVYEFEPSGVGSCAEVEPTYSVREGGCVALISSGASGRQSAFVDASESGDDVFFWTHAKLIPQDTDTAADIYDAHVCDAMSPCVAEPVAAPPCAETSSCRGSLAQPPVATTPGSAVFSGPGNPKPKGKRHNRKHDAKKHHRHPKKKPHKKRRKNKAHGNERKTR